MFKELTFKDVKNEYNEKIAILIKSTDYYHKNQKLEYKKIYLFQNNETKYRIDIYFYKNGRVKKIYDEKRSEEWFFDIKGKNVKEITNETNTTKTLKCGLGNYLLADIDFKLIKANPQKIAEIRVKIDEIRKDSDFFKLYDDFTIKDWERFNEIRDLLKKELSLIIYKNKDIYFKEMPSNSIELIDDDGATYSI